MVNLCRGSEFSGSAIRVTQLTGYLSASPTFTYTALAVDPYVSASVADQRCMQGVSECAIVSAQNIVGDRGARVSRKHGRPELRNRCTKDVLHQ